MKKSGKIIIGLSGGVDSATAAAILKSQGYDVTGVFLNFWKEDKKDKSAAVKEVRDICRILSIPFKVVDARKKFKDCVVKYFLNEYQSGRTPNPCVFCNENMKFKALFDLAEKMKADFVATGHYVRIMERKTDKEKQKYGLFEAKDKNKDQSYFLYRLKQHQLAKLIFPLGKYKKTEVRRMAKKFNLPAFDKAESQNICFIKDDDTQRFLKRYLRMMKKGEIIDQNGKIIGEHQGLPLYTLGQRRGINIGGSGPYYVVSKDSKKNILLVTNDPKELNLYSTGMKVGDISWTAGSAKPPIEVMVKTRYRQQVSRGIIKRKKSGIMEVQFSKPERAVTPGQSAVFYDKNGEVLGGGIIV